MSCTHLYDFVTGARIPLPLGLGPAMAGEEDGRHGVRAILCAGEDAQMLIRDQMKLLADLSPEHRPNNTIIRA
jgi:hypothetical protein